MVDLKTTQSLIVTTGDESHILQAEVGSVIIPLDPDESSLSWKSTMPRLSNWSSELPGTH